MVKGVEFEIVQGDYVKEIDKFVMRLNDTIKCSSGEYIKIPSYSKDPDITIKVLDDKGILSVEGNEITSLSEGYSSIGIMKGFNVIKKVDILVVNPYVEDLVSTIDKNLYYVGDTADIETEVLVDYNKFKTKEPVVYESSNEDVVKVDNNKILATGVGNAVLYVESGNKKEVVQEFNIQAQISQIKIEDTIDIQIEKSTKLNPQIITSPRNLQYGDVKYQFAERKLDIERAISLDQNGNIVGLREGQEKVNIVCQNKTKTININVKPQPISEKVLENLQIIYELIENKLHITLSWDYIENVEDYEVYLKDNLTVQEFSLFETFKIESEQVLENNRVQVQMVKDMGDEESLNLELYVIGKKDDTYTQQSEVVRINLQEDITLKQVKNLSYLLTEENIILNWDSINLGNVTYSIYIRDNTLEDKGFILYDDKILNNTYNINELPDTLDYDIYVVGNQDSKNSKQSEIINIKKVNN